MKRIYVLLAVPVLAVVAACGSDNDTGGATASRSMTTSAAPGQAAGHNDQDVMFAQMMIPHHQQAVEMTALAPGRAAHPEVKQLSKAIEAAQNPEIQKMTGWLNSWGAGTPGEHMHMGHGGAAGMMSEAEMNKLESLSGPAFDRAFLRMMIKHHEGAVTMAKTEQQSGSFAAAKQMAGGIVTSQTAEITKMRQLLANK
jgi:uncharacterized protein (DUF305 family)